MIAEFVKAFDDNRDNLLNLFKQNQPDSYKDIVKAVIDVINPDGKSGLPDPERIHLIDDGDYQGTLVFIITEIGYQPTNYWYVKVEYGSCSGCDTLQSIWYKPTDEQPGLHLLLALHIVQKLKILD